jgi:serine/threonine protein kinase
VKRAGHLAAGSGLNSPLHRHSASDIHDGEEQGNPLYLIKEEIAIMKKLNHPNLVSLIEVLDDPEEDSLYMVLEMCKKGVVMKVGLNDKADPYDEERCRHWFRDLILGIEYCKFVPSLTEAVLKYYSTCTRRGSQGYQARQSSPHRGRCPQDCGLWRV